MPPENQPGHHPPKEQDKPDLDAFAARLGTDPKAPNATNARKGPRAASAAKTAAKSTPAKSTPAKSTPAKSTPAKAAPAKATPAKAAPANTAAAKASSRPAASSPKPSPAGPPKIQATPAKRPAAAPAPSIEDTVHFSVPQPEPEEHREPPFVSLMLMPLRGTVKWLEQLDRTLTERLDPNSRSFRGPDR